VILRKWETYFTTQDYEPLGQNYSRFFTKNGAQRHADKRNLTLESVDRTGVLDIEWSVRRIDERSRA
jgi:hypothetical protein